MGLSSLAEIILAALLHDIGKFYQRGGEKVEFKEIDKQEYLPKRNGHYSHEHALYTLAFLEKHRDYLPKPSKKFEHPDDNYINFAARHHNPGTSYEWIIAEADRISAGMDREEAEPAEKRLVSIFSEVFLEKAKNEEVYYDLCPLKPDKAIFPQKTFAKDIDYKNLWKQFLDEFKNLPYNYDFHVYLPSLISVLEKYTWCIPSATYHTLPDISLFDHSLSTAALSSALFLYHQHKGSLSEKAIKDRKEKKFLLVALDLSGIQKFIFDVTIDAAKGAAKMLRARSFYLSLLLEVACLKILDAFGLYIVNRIMDAGGRSILLLPNLDDAKERVKDIQREIELFLKHRHFAELSINTAFLEIAAADLEAEHFSETLNHLNAEIELAKKKKFSFIEEFVYTDFTKKYDPQKGLCKACGKHYGEVEVENQYYCQYCEEFKRLGQWLTKCDFMAFDKEKKPKKGLKIFDWYVHFFNRDEIYRNRADFYLCYSLKPFPGFPIRHIANYVPKFDERDNYNDVYTSPRFSSEELINEAINGIKNKSVKTFHHIALSSLWRPDEKSEYKGRTYLGVLKADVDRLGFVFSYGLNHPQRPSPNRLTLARFCFLSRMLDFFFTGYLPEVLKKEFPDTYTVFAGGDDLFLVGPWESMIYLAERIYNDFRNYTGNNPDITISASLTLVNPRYPVNAVAPLAEKTLDEAKHAGRDRLWSFGEIVKWKTFPELKRYFLFLDQLLNQSEGKIGTAFIYKLLTLAEMKEEFERKGKIEKGRWHALFKYLLGRNLKHLGEQVNELQQMFCPMKEYALKVPLSWVLFKNRK